MSIRMMLTVPLCAYGLSVFAQTAPDFISTDGFEHLQAMRIDSLELRDPHLFATISIFCSDITSTINAQIEATLNADENEDGYLDNSAMLYFRPLHASGRRDLAHTGGASCTAPATGTSCEADGSPWQPLPYDGLAVGTCLAPIPDTVHPYSPPVTNSVGPCFASEPADADFDLGFTVPLQDMRIGGSRRDSPTPGLSNGLLYGFLTEEAANVLLVPLPLIGTVPLSSLLPGGSGNCAAHSDMDEHNGVQGWWLYFNYQASEVPYVK